MRNVVTTIESKAVLQKIEAIVIYYLTGCVECGSDCSAFLLFSLFALQLKFDIHRSDIIYKKHIVW